MELDEWDEVFELSPPGLSFHNLIMGQPYIDIESTAILRDLKKPEKRAVIQFHKRGWTQASYFKLDGVIYSDKDEVAYTFEGKWNDSITLTDVKTGESEVVWQKKPYPENWQYMYGMTYHSLQLNYLTK